MQNKKKYYTKCKRLVLIIESFILLAYLCGCADTGIHSPQQLASTMMDALATYDVDLFAECFIPGGMDTMYSMHNLAGQIGGQSARDSMDESLSEMEEYRNEYFPKTYGVSKDTKISGQAYLLDMSESASSAVVHFIGILAIGDMYDYDEMYLSAYRLGNSWYLSSIQDWKPYGYVPDKVFVQNEQVSSILSKMDQQRIMPLDPDAGSGTLIYGTDVGYVSSESFGSKSIELPNKIVTIWDTLGEKEKRLWFDLSVKRELINIWIDSPSIEAFWECYDGMNTFQLGLTNAALTLTKGIEDVAGDMIHLVDASIKLSTSLPAAIYSDYMYGKDGHSEVINVAQRYLDGMKFSNITATVLGADLGLAEIDLSEEIIAYLQEDVNSYESSGEYTQNCVSNLITVYNDPQVQAAITTLKKLNQATSMNASEVVDFAKTAGFSTWLNDCRGIICSGKVLVNGNTININLPLEQVLDFDRLLSKEVNRAELTEFIKMVEQGTTLEKLDNTSPHKYFLNPKYKEYIYEEMYRSKNQYFGKLDVGKLDTILNIADGITKAVSAYQMKDDSEKLLAKWEVKLQDIADNYKGNNDQWMSNVLYMLQDNVNFAMSNAIEAFSIPFVNESIEQITSKMINDALTKIAPKAAKGASAFFTAALAGIDIGVGLTNAKETHGKIPSLKELSDHYYDMKEELATAMDTYVDNPTSAGYEQLRMKFLLYSIARGSTAIGIYQVFINEEESIRNRVINGTVMAADFCVKFFNAFKTGCMEQVWDGRKQNIESMKDSIAYEVKHIQWIEENLFPYEAAQN